MMEEELWLVAAQRVLSQSQQALHYTDIKRIILEQGLVSPRLKTTLEEALFKEIQRPGGRFRSIIDQAGYFELTAEVEFDDEPPEIFSRPRVPTILKSRLVPKVVRTKPLAGANSLMVQEKYKSKYRRLKKHIKDRIFMNAAICDGVIRTEEKILHIKDERRYLLTRLLQHQSMTDTLSAHNSGTVSPSGSSGKHTAQSIAQILGEVEKRKKKAHSGMTGNKKKASKELSDDSKPKPKRPKASSGRRMVLPLPLDNLGRPVFPIELGHLTVYCVGEIIADRTGFHSSEYIFPVGFCSTRQYVSVRAPEDTCLYTCKILDSGAGPKFDISPDDAPDLVFSGFSASECHIKLLKAINHSRGSDVVPLTARGADFFGLSHPTIQNLVQSCPGSKKCAHYKWVKFEVSKVPMDDNHGKDEPTVNIDTLFTLPTFVSLKKSQQAQQASLRSLLTTGPS